MLNASFTSSIVRPKFCNLVLADATLASLTALAASLASLSFTAWASSASLAASSSAVKGTFIPLIKWFLALVPLC